ncbi:MAG: nitrate/nitrite transporter NrtS [Limisphaerales bacterium]
MPTEGSERSSLVKPSPCCNPRVNRLSSVVTVILIAINDSDAILSGQITRGVSLKMLLTVMVPYGVSTFSSVGVLLEMRGKP